MLRSLVGSEMCIRDRSNRGHKLSHTIKAITLLKDNCFKVDIHLMPNLFGSTPEKDLEMFQTILYNPQLQADQIKIYPVSVVPWSVYETMYKNGKYVPYSDEKLKQVIIYMKKRIHPWIRLNRVIRDIPISYISGGCSQPNMRQSLSKLCNCRCIRSREVKGREIGKAYRKVRQYAETIYEGFPYCHSLNEISDTASKYGADVIDTTDEEVVKLITNKNIVTTE